MARANIAMASGFGLYHNFLRITISYSTSKWPPSPSLTILIIISIIIVVAAQGERILHILYSAMLTEVEMAIIIAGSYPLVCF